MKLGPELFDRLNAEQWIGNQTPVVYGQGGLSEHEISAIEEQLGFPWPEDFRYLFQNVRDPGGVLFPWKNFEKQSYDEQIAWVLQGLEFDVEHANFWMRRWGEQPKDLAAALEIARGDFAKWPKLLPICGHRFLVAEPCFAGNPVFSIMQNGYRLLWHEFGQLPRA